MAIEQTLILCKGDAVARGLVGEILARFERRGYTIAALALLTVDRSRAETHYAEHKGKPFFDGLVDYITSAPIVALVVEGSDAIEGCRTAIGATNPIKAAPGSIRGDFGQTIGRNLVHGSDSPESAKREIAIWFTPAEIHARPHDQARWLIST
ncbi:MAG TPA: nucleoside-diphosphate kinase [Candidatus Baltobacteraceae bacterium]